MTRDDEITMKKDSIWWRLTPLAACLTLAGMIGLSQWQEAKWVPPLYTAMPLGLAIALPILYLNAFALWHWKYRYRGNRPVAWAVGLPLLAFCIPALLYFALHINPDRVGKGPYSTIEPVCDKSHLPGKYNILRSVCFVVGGALIGWASFASIILTVAFSIIFSKVDRAVSLNAGKVLTAGDVQALHWSYEATCLFVGCLCAVAVSGALGGILLYLSNNLRWRLREKDNGTVQPSDAPRPVAGK
jgi:hypothetical protein